MEMPSPRLAPLIIKKDTGILYITVAVLMIYVCLGVTAIKTQGLEWQALVMAPPVLLFFGWAKWVALKLFRHN